jgi:hypothetical protein
MPVTPSTRPPAVTIWPLHALRPRVEDRHAGHRSRFFQPGNRHADPRLLRVLPLASTMQHDALAPVHTTSSRCSQVAITSSSKPT